VTHPFVITALKTLTLLLGGTITLFAYRAYRRTGIPALRALTIGFGVVTVGTLLAGAVDLLAPGLERETALIVESSLTVVGFAVILYSLYVE
jgi:hypothetical protein